MEFYVFDDIKEGKFKSTGIGIDAMVKVLKAIEKEKHAKTIDELEPYNIVYLENAKFLDNEVIFKGKVKKEEFALVKTGKTFTIEQSGEIYFVMLANGKLNIAKDFELLNKFSENKDIEHYSETEKKAYHWLETGKTGLSSLVMCHTLLPRITHNKIESLGKSHSDSYPHDTSDFNRCLGLLESVPELRQDLYKLKDINQQWNNLVQKWADIENAIKENKLDEANSMISQSSYIHKMKKI